MRDFPRGCQQELRAIEDAVHGAADAFVRATEFTESDPRPAGKGTVYLHHRLSWYMFWRVVDSAHRVKEHWVSEEPGTGRDGENHPSHVRLGDTSIAILNLRSLCLSRRHIDLDGSSYYLLLEHCGKALLQALVYFLGFGPQGHVV